MLHAGDFLTDEERDVLRWGGNAKVTVPPRFSKSGSHGVTYKRATALECLVSTISSRPLAVVHVCYALVNEEGRLAQSSTAPRGSLPRAKQQ